MTNLWHWFDQSYTSTPTIKLFQNMRSMYPALIHVQPQTSREECSSHCKNGDFYRRRTKANSGFFVNLIRAVQWADSWDDANIWNWFIYLKIVRAIWNYLIRSSCHILYKNCKYSEMRFIGQTGWWENQNFISALIIGPYGALVSSYWHSSISWPLQRAIISFPRSYAVPLCSHFQMILS